MELHADSILLDALFALSPDVVLRVDGTGAILRAGGASEELLGAAPGELVGRELGTVLPDAPLEALLPRGRARVERRGSGGETLGLDVLAGPVAGGGAVLLVRRAGGDPGLVDALRRAREQHEELAYVVSHDLQEPLRSTAGFASLLAERCGDELGASGREFLGFVVDGVQRMQGMLRDLLAYARVGRGEPAPAPVPVREALDEALQTLRGELDAAGARVEVVGELPVVLAERPRLVELFRQLLDNARKFCGDAPPRVTVEAARRGDRWEIAVRDRGVGIEPRHAERVLAPFQRLHTREEAPGSGIGLALCRRIVERHGGTIRVEAREGGGVTVAFRLAPAEGPAPARPGTPDTASG